MEGQAEVDGQRVWGGWRRGGWADHSEGVREEGVSTTTQGMTQGPRASVKVGHGGSTSTIDPSAEGSARSTIQGVVHEHEHEHDRSAEVHVRVHLPFLF